MEIWILVEGDESNFNKLDSSFESNTTTTGSSGYSTKPDHSMHRSLNTYNELQVNLYLLITHIVILMTFILLGFTAHQRTNGKKLRDNQRSRRTSENGTNA